MAFWLFLPALALAAAGFVVVPVLRRRSLTPPAAPPEATSPAAGNRQILWLGLGLAAIVTVPAIVLYSGVGRPDLAATDSGRVATRTAAPSSDEGAPLQSLDAMITQLKERVRKSPSDADAWRTLGWAYMHIRKPADAMKTYQRAVALNPSDAPSLSALAEASIQSGSGKISDATRADLQKVVALDPADARAHFYLALYKDQQGDHKGAIADWITLLKSAPPDAGWPTQVRAVVEQVALEEHINIAGQLPPESAPADAVGTPETMPGPDAGQIAAAGQMSANDRATMIGGMVDKLAAELKQNPHDAAGWQRLMRARVVLGQKDQAAAAWRDARTAFAREPAQLAELDTAAHNFGIAPQ